MHSITLHACLLEPTAKIWMQIDPYCQWRKCSPVNVVSSDVRVMQIFTGVREIWGVKQEGGRLRCRFLYLLLSAAIIGLWCRWRHRLIIAAAEATVWPVKLTQCCHTFTLVLARLSCCHYNTVYLCECVCFCMCRYLTESCTYHDMVMHQLYSCDIPGMCVCCNCHWL